MKRRIFVTERFLNESARHMSRQGMPLPALTTHLLACMDYDIAYKQGERMYFHEGRFPAKLCLQGASA